jgi:Autotransporter beta-domain
MPRRGWVATGLASCSAAALTLTAGDAHALGPVDVEVAGVLGVGTDPLSHGGPNPLSVVGGGRAGVALHGLYAGVALAYAAGGTDSHGSFTYVSTGRVAAPSSSDHAWMYGVEAGYGFRLAGLLTIRPQVGLGDLTLSYAQPTGSDICGLPCNQTLSGHVDSPYVLPGVTVLASLGVLLVGADAGALILPAFTEPFATSSTTDVAFTAHVQLGVRF